MVDLHGGTVAVSSPGRGSGAVFSVKLPLTAVQVYPHDESRVHPNMAAGALSPADRVDLGGVVKILVLDDEADARILIKRLLESCQAQVAVAATSDEALPMLSSFKPDVIVSDIGMPDVDGYEFLRRVRGRGAAHGGNIPAIALTAFARSEDRTRALLAGYQVHVSKPVEPAELLATVASVAGRTAYTA